MSPKRLSFVNTWLVVLIILVNSYVIIAPFLPALQFWTKDRFATSQRAQLVKQTEPQTIPYSGANKIVIPSIFVDQPILEGPNINTAMKGIWRLPSGSSPDKGGNTVLIGHRFLYSRNPAVFYNLDKVTKGDKIGIFWNNKQYRYQVNEVKVVPPSQTDVEAATDDSRITLYTCTPLWTSKNRLVIVANLIGEGNE